MMNAATATLPLDPTFPTADIARLNGAVWLHREEDLCVVWVHHTPWHRFVASSELDRRIVGANLVMAGLAKTVEVVGALDLSRATLHRDRQRLAEGGLPALAAIRKGPKGPSKAGPALSARAQRQYRAGMSKNAIAHKLGVSEGTIRLILKEEPAPAHAAGQAELLSTVAPAPTLIAAAAREPAVRPEKAGPEAVLPEAVLPEAGLALSEIHPATTNEGDLDRSVERVCARFGLIREAAVRFVAGRGLPFVGVLLMLPALVALGFFREIEAAYGKLKNGFYGLRHTVLTLCLMLALRITRAEHLTGVAPAALGRLLGLDRAPEVKTLRRRVHEIARLGHAGALMRGLARRVADNDAETLGFLYVDGHVRAYFGNRPIAKAYITQRRLAMPAVSDFWVNDAGGEPLLVVTGEVSGALTVQLLPILEEVRALLPAGQRATVVFDRGGWSPKLFRQILAAGFDLLTYRKGKCPRYPVKDFVEYHVQGQGAKRSYWLRDGWVRPGAKLTLRCVVRRRDDGHQTHIVSSRRDLPAAAVAERMFARWRQENYFKYAAEEFGLDALDTYAATPADPARTVPNPARAKLDEAIASARKQVRELEARLGRAIDANAESHRASTRGFKIAHAALRKELGDTRARLAQLIARRHRLPKRVAVSETVPDNEPAMALAVEHKHFMNIVKMAVYRAETALYRQLDPHYRRTEQDGRALLREAFRAAGSLEVGGGFLRVTLAPLSAPRRTQAIAALCRELNAVPTRIPGTSLRLQFDVQDQECLK